MWNLKHLKLYNIKAHGSFWGSQVDCGAGKSRSVPPAFAKADVLDLSSKFCWRNPFCCADIAESHSWLSTSIICDHITVHQNHVAQCRTRSILASCKSLSGRPYNTFNHRSLAQVVPRLSCIWFRDRLFLLNIVRFVHRGKGRIQTQDVGHRNGPGTRCQLRYYSPR